MKFFLLIAKNVGRNRVRSILTSLGTMVLVFVVTLVWSVLAFLENVTAEKSRNLKAIVSERWQIPSLMPFTYADKLQEGAARQPGDVRPLDSMTWQFYGGTTDKVKMTRESILFAVAMEPKKVRTMMDELDELPPDQVPELDAAIKLLDGNHQGIIVGRERLAALNKRVGDRIKIYGIGNFKGLDLEFEILGLFPPGRYDQSAVMHRDYYNQALDAYPRANAGRKHSLAERSLSLMWLRVPDKDSFNRLATQITTSPYFSTPTVKCETASSGVATFLEAFRDIIWGVRWLLAPAALVTLSLLIANAISISVRERRTELAVLKVLGFRPTQILLLVLGEALLIGTLSGLASAGLTCVVVDVWMGGIKFPIAFFPSFPIPWDATWWGAAMGAGTAFFGAIVPAWSARSVRVADVFSKVA